MVEVEPIDLKSSHTVIVAAVESIVILIPLINTAFGTHFLMPSDPQQAALVTLIEIVFILAGYLYIIYRRATVVRGPTKSAVAKMQSQMVDTNPEPVK